MADSYSRYKDARNAAWGLLKHFKISALPVDAEALLGLVGVDVLPYPDRETDARLYTAAREASDAACVSLQIGGVWRVFIDRARLTAEQQNFALAHELAHIVMKHALLRNEAGIRTFAGTENEGDIIDAPRDADDYTADIFAVRVLAPACVLHDLRVTDEREVAQLCHLPPKAAQLRAERMRMLNARGVFYTLPIEKQVHENFMPFIRQRMSAAEIPQRRILTHGSVHETADADAEQPVTVPVMAEKRRKIHVALPFWLRRLLQGAAVLAALAVLYLLLRWLGIS